MDRYFYITFSTKDKSGAPGDGSVQFTLDHFPGKNELTGWIVEKFGTSDVVITNIFEFRTKEDYESFTTK